MLSIALTLAIAAPSLASVLDPFIEQVEASGGLIGVVVSPTRGSDLYDHMANARLMPASNVKIATAAFAFDVLASDYQLTTRFWREPEGIYIDAPGDQTIEPEHFRAVAQALNCKGGDRVFARQAYDLGSGPGWEIDDLPFRYAPRIQALSVHRAQFEVMARGGSVVVPSWSLAKFTVHLRATPKEPTFDLAHRRVHLYGPIPVEDAILARFALPDPAASAASFFGRTYRATSTVPNRTPDTIIRGPALRDWAKLCLEPSDNLLAESLLLAAADQVTEGRVDYPVAQAAIAKHYEDKLSLGKSMIRIQDGSGLSRHNLVTARAMARILQYVYAQPYRDEFKRALPSPGEGTLSNRLFGLRAAAKTGSLDSVSCLSGYLDVGKSEPLVFSILMNHHALSASRAREIQDGMIRAIAEWGATNLN